MTRRFLTLCLMATALPVLTAATLEQLSLEQMIQKSTAIVRGRILGSTTIRRGMVLYTTSRVQVLERWKGAAAGQVEVSVPGGAMSGLRQTFSGAPRLADGGEYVLFLWTGKSGVTHVIGLSQGLFHVQGEMLYRSASGETMLDGGGRAVADQDLRMSMAQMRAAIAKGMEAERK